MKGIGEKMLTLSFDLKTLDHLGIKLYSQIPTMIAELVSNAWDADATEVKMYFNDSDDKEIIICDNGTGMSFEELNECYLKIGRNRRIEENIDFTVGKHRPILGKKGLGKLSVFGIGKELTVTTIKNGLKNKFTMNYEHIKSRTNGTYHPILSITDQASEEQNGTIIQISNILRSTDFNTKEIAESLSKRFTVFSEDFQVSIYHNDKDKISITNDLYTDTNAQFTWNFPEDYKGKIEDILYEFALEKEIKGRISTFQKTIYTSKQGIILFSRGKLVQENSNFHKRGNDNFFSYMSGYFDVDFIDLKGNEDYSSTDRRSLAWDAIGNNSDDLLSLKQLLEAVVNKTQSEWRIKRSELKKKQIKEIGLDINKWLKSLTLHEKPLAKQLYNSILNNDNIETEKAKEYIGYIQDMFSYESFKSFTTELDNLFTLENESAIKLLTDWQIIEAKEFAKIAEGRIKTIEQFEKYILEDASERDIIQKFLKEFPWLLDPKMSNFESEVTYSRILKERFPDEKLEEPNRRIDFLCNNNNGLVHIIELKRPSIKIGLQEIGQIADYHEFLKDKYPNDITNVVSFLISDNYDMENSARSIANSLEKDGKLYLKSYSDLLQQAKRYHSQFINIYNEIEKKEDR